MPCRIRMTGLVDRDAAPGWTGEPREPLYSAIGDGIRFSVLPVGRRPAGLGDRALHPAPARHDLAVDHRLPRPAGRPRLHRDGGPAGLRAAAPLLRRIRPAEADQTP